MCVDLWGLKKLTLIDMFPTSFSDEIINEFTKHEFYSFNDDFLGYNQVPIAKEDHWKKHYLSVRVIHIQSNVIWDQECSSSIFLDSGKIISRIHLQKNGCIL
jgi:hypothetical protein